VTEAFTQGIPLIIWPVGAEQTVTAAMLSAEPNPVAIELLQVLSFRTLF
jgi:UDP:flavonoid glycosyltransferase YjiC (YdhE family)